MSLAAHAPPTRAEDLLVLGLLVAIAAHIGTPGLRVAAAIGDHCGFADQAHFGRAFKQHAGMTPVQYRQAFGTARGDQVPARPQQPAH